jgi:hypothetical protein
MKKLVLIISLLFSTVIAFSQAEIRNDGAVHATGNFPVALSSEIKGTPKRVRDTIERNAIQASFRDTGMFVHVTNINKTYQLQGGILNTNWVEYSGAGGDSTKAIKSVGKNITNDSTIIKLKDNTTYSVKDSAIINGINHDGTKKILDVAANMNLKVLSVTSTSLIPVMTNNTSAASLHSKFYNCNYKFNKSSTFCTF